LENKYKIKKSKLFCFSIARFNVTKSDIRIVVGKKNYYITKSNMRIVVGKNNNDNLSFLEIHGLFF
jgi:hypothetical protein